MHAHEVWCVFVCMCVCACMFKRMCVCVSLWCTTPQQKCRVHCPRRFTGEQTTIIALMVQCSEIRISITFFAGVKVHCEPPLSRQRLRLHPNKYIHTHTHAHLFVAQPRALLKWIKPHARNALYLYQPSTHWTAEYRGLCFNFATTLSRLSACRLRHRWAWSFRVEPLNRIHFWCTARHLHKTHAPWIDFADKRTTTPTPTWHDDTRSASRLIRPHLQIIYNLYVALFYFHSLWTKHNEDIVLVQPWSRGKWFWIQTEQWNSGIYESGWKGGGMWRFVIYRRDWCAVHSFRAVLAMTFEWKCLHAVRYCIAMRFYIKKMLLSGFQYDINIT